MRNSIIVSSSLPFIFLKSRCLKHTIDYYWSWARNIRNMYVLQFDISSSLAIKYTMLARQIRLTYCFIFQRRIHRYNLTLRPWRSKNIYFVFIPRFRNIYINVELLIKLVNNNVIFLYQQSVWYLINIIWKDQCPKAKMHKGVQKRNVCSQITWNERCCQESTSKAILNTLNFKPQFKQRQV